MKIQFRSEIPRFLMITILLICLSFLPTKAQTLNQLTLDSCYALSVANFPLIQQHELISKAAEFSIDNANKGYYPRINVAGQATHQSEVTQIAIPIPGFRMTELSKNQFRLYGEVNQPLTDLFVIKDQKELIHTTSKVESLKVEVELYKLRERVNQLFFGILLMDAQLELTKLFTKDIETSINKTKAAVNNGLSLDVNLDMLKAEQLKVNQRAIELKSARNAYADMLSQFIHTPISESTALVMPTEIETSTNINRPELNLFDQQRKVFNIQSKLITAQNLPHLNFFMQGGAGRPALNMLSNDVKGYYIGGLRLSWNLSGYYTYNRDKELLKINQNSLDIQRETFLFNTNLVLKQQNSEVLKLRELISSDEEIVRLRQNISSITKSQLENGMATTNDLVSHLNAVDQARQNLALHQIQLRMAQHTSQNTAGK